MGRAPEINEWARWLQRSLHLDISPWLLPELAMVTSPFYIISARKLTNDERQDYEYS